MKTGSTDGDGAPPDDIDADEDDFDTQFWDTMVNAAYKRYLAGATVAQAEELVVTAFQPAIAAASAVFRDALVEAEPRMLREHRNHDRAFRRRLRHQWGPALDRLLAVIVAAEEIGANFDRRHTEHAIASNDLLFEALTRLHARACRIASECHSLLGDGFPMGALGRCRTLHEISVTAQVLREFGANDDSTRNTDIAERYLLHELSQTYSDAKAYQAICPATGWEPYSDAEMAAMKVDHDDLIQRFGPDFKGPYGWAAAALGNRQPDFTVLEKAANIAHFRSHYKWASHEVHADATGARMNNYETEAGYFKASGRVDTGLADPGQLTAVYLHQVTAALVLSVHAGPRNLVELTVLRDLVDSVGDLFTVAQAEAAEH